MSCQNRSLCHCGPCCTALWRRPRSLHPPCSPHPPQHSRPSAHSSSQQAAGWGEGEGRLKRFSEKPIHSVGRNQTPAPTLVIPVPCSLWNLNASLIAAAMECSVIKRIRKHLYCDHASCQQCTLKQNMKTAFMFNLQKFILRYYVLLYV